MLKLSAINILSISLISLFLASFPSLSQENEVFEEFKDSERYRIDSTQKTIKKMKIPLDSSKRIKMNIDGSFSPAGARKRQKTRELKRNCDSNDVFIDKDGDGINDNRVKGMGLGKRKGLGKGRCKQEKEK